MSDVMKASDIAYLRDYKHRLATGKTALFIIMSDTDPTFNLSVSLIYSQSFNLL